MKKTLSILLISAMLLAIMPLAIFAAPTGTAITSASQLYNISTSDTGNYYLANDITISGYWEGKNFKGNLDGNGHTIYLEDGVTIKNGVFNGLWGSYVKNLNIIQKGSATYQARSSAIGVLTRGVNNNNVTISNVYSVHQNKKRKSTVSCASKITYINKKSETVAYRRQFRIILEWLPLLGSNQRPLDLVSVTTSSKNLLILSPMSWGTHIFFTHIL